MGLSGKEVAEARKNLAGQGYWLTAQGGMDESFRHALMTFQRVAGRPITGRLTWDEAVAIGTAQPPVALEKGPAHIEVDLGRQVLFYVNEQGTVEKILPVSSGNQAEYSLGNEARYAVTPTGSFTISQKFPGWTKSPLGMMYYPNFFLGGIAIHGSPSVPPKPASHGCIRIPLFAAKEFSQMIPLGTKVLVYDHSSKPNTAEPDSLKTTSN